MTQQEAIPRPSAILKRIHEKKRTLELEMLQEREKEIADIRGMICKSLAGAKSLPVVTHLAPSYILDHAVWAPLEGMFTKVGWKLERYYQVGCGNVEGQTGGWAIRCHAMRDSIDAPGGQDLTG